MSNHPQVHQKSELYLVKSFFSSFPPFPPGYPNDEVWCLTEFDILHLTHSGRFPFQGSQVKALRMHFYYFTADWWRPVHWNHMFRQKLASSLEFLRHTLLGLTPFFTS